MKLLANDREAKVNVFDQDDMAPLHFAAKNGNHELVRFLIDHGANVNVSNRK